jgi:hypothetical protein
VRRRFNRAAACWYGAGLVAVQLALGVAIERSGTTIRDPDYTQKMARLAHRRAELPTRPQVIVLGSSRALLGFDGELLTRTDGHTLVFNFSEFGAGPMLEQVFLRRLLADGVRPDLVLLEVAPLQLAAGDVVPAEESWLDTGRLTWDEMRQVAGYYRFPITAYARWFKSRALASVIRQREIRATLHIDESRTEVAAASADDYGFLPATPPPQDVRAASIQSGLDRYRQRLANARLSGGQVQALRDLVALCRREHLPFALVLMPETCGFRDVQAPAFLAQVDLLIAELSGDRDVELIDARTWIADDGFLDSHHLDAGGATVFSTRFAKEALPRLRRHYYSSCRAEHSARKDESEK